MSKMNATEMALTQCQHIAYDGSLMIDNLPCRREMMAALNPALVNYVKALEAKVERIANIAEAGEPDEDFKAMLERDRRAEEIIPGVTVGSTEDDMAKVDADAEELAEHIEGAEPRPDAGEMSTSDGLGGERYEFRQGTSEHGDFFHVYDRKRKTYVAGSSSNR